MTLFWTAGVLLAFTLSGAGVFLALHLGTNEQVPLQRARALWRWSVVVVLATFNWWIFSRVFGSLRELI